MTPRDLQTVHASFVQLLPVLDQVVEGFYQRLFELDPTLRSLFTTDIDKQRQKFGQMLDTLLGDPERFEVLLPALHRMGQRHLEYGVHGEHYATVGEALLYALGQTLGDSFTAEVREAWAAVYNKLSEEMLKAQATLQPRPPL